MSTHIYVSSGLKLECKHESNLVTVATDNFPFSLTQEYLAIPCPLDKYQCLCIFLHYSPATLHSVGSQKFVVKFSNELFYRFV